MTDRYLLDTNIVSDLIRRPFGRIRMKIADLPEDAVATSIIVAAELRFGAARKTESRLSSQLERLLSTLKVLPFEPPADRAYGEIRATFGKLIGANDLFIAAHALAQGMIVVTDNEREFRRVKGLRVANWLRD